MFKKKRGQPSISTQKSPKPRPEWTTDFTDHSKYKLSQAQMIQKKAALQSSNRERAKQDLEERRKKLEMGIIDDETRKIYQTALMAKNIDINPPIRKNLSQMIQYQKDRQSTIKDDRCNSKQDLNEFQQQLKNTQVFIKKMQKANKQDQINKAIDILEKNQKNISPKKYKQDKSNNKIMNSFSKQQSMLSNIQDTIKFMEQKLFSKKVQKRNINENYKEEESYNQKQIKKNTSLKEIKIIDQIHQNQIQHQNLQRCELSHLKIDLHQKQEQFDADCMNTIRKMRQMIQSKQGLYFNEMHEKQNVPSYSNTIQQSAFIPKKIDSEAEIDFSLTINNDQDHHSKQINKKEYLDQFESVKQSLYNEINKMKSCNYLEDKSILKTDSHKKSQKKIVKQKSPNVDLERIKNMIHGTKKNAQSLVIEPLGLPKNYDTGFDFRGSINIRKNLIQ